MKTIAVVGMGSSGQSAAKLGISLGYTVHCIDRQESTVPNGCTFHLENDVDITSIHTSQIVVSPGVPKHNTVLQQAIKEHIPIVSELNFASNHLSCPILAVTGTNGKSSTVWYVKQMAEQLGLQPFLGGNFGKALSEMVLDMREQATSYGLAIVEVSSYQLEWSHDFHANSSTVLNLTPDHLARHKTMKEYRRCKMKIFDHQTENDWAILPIQASTLHPSTTASMRFFGTAPSDKSIYGCFTDDTHLHWYSPTTKWRLERTKIPLLGLHNHHNIAAALLLLQGVTSIQVTPELCLTLQPLEHRLEPLHQNGRVWINDSKATNIEATQAALASMTTPVTLLLGGAGKQGAQYTQLLPHIEDIVSSIICFGSSGTEIQQQLSPHLPEKISCDFVIDLSSAIQLARLQKETRPILLSPACASFDAFTNFEHRGRYFKETIRQQDTE